MRIVVTGKDGQIARALMERGPGLHHQIVPVGRPVLDLLGDANSIAAALTAARPDAIVSAAAYTAVDQAETDREVASVVNAAGAGAVACAANYLGVPLIHLSTDYVFDGTKPEPYNETDVTRPTTVYGRTKLLGEQKVLEAHDNVVVLRTAWVYSPFGTNFVKTMLRLAAGREGIGVVADQIGNPTSALDLADGVLAVASSLAASSAKCERGIFHMTGSGEASWARFAEAIFAASAASGGPTAVVSHISSNDFPTRARRPVNSRLDCSKLAAVHSIQLPDWRRSIVTVVDRLLGANANP